MEIELFCNKWVELDLFILYNIAILNTTRKKIGTVVLRMDRLQTSPFRQSIFFKFLCDDIQEIFWLQNHNLVKEDSQNDILGVRKGGTFLQPCVVENKSVLKIH